MYIKMYVGGGEYQTRDKEDRKNLEDNGWKVIINGNNYLVLQHYRVGVKERVYSELNKFGMKLGEDYEILSKNTVSEMLKKARPTMCGISPVRIDQFQGVR